jgi:uncharacterized membrane protein YhaH (DUF805 family)
VDGLGIFRSSVAAFYPYLIHRFHSFVGRVRRNRFVVFHLLHVRSEVKKIVHWVTKILFATEIAFRGLDRCVPEQKLNLLKLTASIVAQLCTGSPQIMRRDVL